MSYPLILRPLLLGWILALTWAVGAFQDAVSPERVPDLAQVQKGIVAQTNEFRTQESRSVVKTNEQLAKAAAYFAGYLARTGKFSHTADGQEPWERAVKHGYDYCIVLENIALEFNSKGFTTEELAQAFMKGWKDSPGHRKNMLDRDVTEIGVAVAHDRDSGKYYAVQMFGRPKAEAIVFKVANEADVPVEYTIDGKSQTVQPRYTVTHRQCRPPELIFQLEAIKDKMFHPGTGDRYVVRKAAPGGYKVEKEKE